MTYHVARNGDPDAILVFFTCCYFLSYFIILDNEGNTGIQYYIIFAAAITGAVLTKSIAGAAPLAGLVVYTFSSRKGIRLIQKPAIHISWISALFVVSAYYIIKNVFNPGFLEAVYQNEIKLISANAHIKHAEFVFYYIHLKTLGFQTYFYLLPVVIIPLLFGKDEKIRQVIRYSLLCAIIYLVGSSLSVTKNEWYIAPIYPFLWLALGVSLYESYRITIHSLPNKYLKAILSLIVIYYFIYISEPRYTDAYEINTYSTTNNAYIYEPERAGHYLKSIKKKYPEHKDFIALISYHPRQLNFYIEKFRYEDGTKVEVVNHVPDFLNNDHVFTCEQPFKDEIESGYNYSLIDSSKYGKLYFVQSPVNINK
jgi:hypothetical protein